MEQNKFDNEIRTKLGKRRLEPSEGAWEKLSQRLEAEEGPKKVSPILWMGIAASLVGLLLLVSQFFNADSNAVMDQNTPIKVVKTPLNTEVETETKKDVPAVKNEQDNLTPKASLNAVAERLVKPEAPASNKIENPIIIQESIVLDESVARNPLPGNKASSEIADNTSDFEAQKIEDIVKNVQAVADRQQEVSDAYLDSLFTAAEKDIQRQKFINKTKGTVDADALLADVENELDESFRTKVFDALKSSFNSVKTTVANRNN
ncbi:hypothetical protein [Gaetbulibacter aestuarii]|uniref:Anti-sigma factor n=1 Tax=Gaetbulibacter aestuarii TaxID=1502358 RepID=A0ABW7MZX8_9FLAO